jgi:hypothetical protein
MKLAIYKITLGKIRKLRVKIINQKLQMKIIFNYNNIQAEQFLEFS